jgi:hypothetical protein
MKSLLSLAVALVLALGLAVSTGAADEITMAGKIVCAKCTLGKADAKECQDVFIDARSNVEYYIQAEHEDDAAGHQCGGEVKATVTGAVSEKDGKRWILPSKVTKG